MKGLVTLINDWRKRRKENERSTKLREIQDSFQVKELNGTLYLMCQGVPYKQVNEIASAVEITASLNEARMAMFSYLENKNHVPA